LDVIAGGDALLLIVVDGMGGHAHGARAAEVTVATLKEAFAEVAQPVFDPQGFLTLSLARAHDRVVKLGDGVALDHKPRATCAVCLVQDGGAYWAHVGDSRIYQLRRRDQTRTRDHSRRAVAARLIAERDARHPTQLVECCLSGDVPLLGCGPHATLEPGDVLPSARMASEPPQDSDFANVSRGDRTPLDHLIRSLAERAVASNSPHSDNTSVAAARWHGP
jgi:hypothetical protein